MMIKKINIIKYGKKFLKFLINSDILTDKIIKIPSVTIVIKSILEKNNKFYLELSLNHLSYKLKKC